MYSTFSSSFSGARWTDFSAHFASTGTRTVYAEGGMMIWVGETAPAENALGNFYPHLSSFEPPSYTNDPLNKVWVRGVKSDGVLVATPNDAWWENPPAP